MTDKMVSEVLFRAPPRRSRSGKSSTPSARPRPARRPSGDGGSWAFRETWKCSRWDPAEAPGMEPRPCAGRGLRERRSRPRPDDGAYGRRCTRSAAAAMTPARAASFAAPLHRRSLGSGASRRRAERPAGPRRRMGGTASFPPPIGTAALEGPLARRRPLIGSDVSLVPDAPPPVGPIRGAEDRPTRDPRGKAEVARAPRDRGALEIHWQSIGYPNCQLAIQAGPPPNRVAMY